MKDALGTKITVTLLTVEKQSEKMSKDGRKTNKTNLVIIVSGQPGLYSETLSHKQQQKYPPMLFIQSV